MGVSGVRNYEKQDAFKEQYTLFLRSRLGHPSFSFDELQDFWGIDNIGDVETFSIEVYAQSCLWQSNVDFIKSILLATDIGVQQIFNVTSVPATGIKPSRWQVWLRIGEAHRDAFIAWETSVKEEAQSNERTQARLAKLMQETKALRRAVKPKRTKSTK